MTQSRHVADTGGRGATCSSPHPLKTRCAAWKAGNLAGNSHVTALSERRDPPLDGPGRIHPYRCRSLSASSLPVPATSRRSPPVGACGARGRQRAPLPCAAVGPADRPGREKASSCTRTRYPGHPDFAIFYGQEAERHLFGIASKLKS